MRRLLPVSHAATAGTVPCGPVCKPSSLQIVFVADGTEEAVIRNLIDEAFAQRRCPHREGARAGGSDRRPTGNSVRSNRFHRAFIQTDFRQRGGPVRFVPREIFSKSCSAMSRSPASTMAPTPQIVRAICSKPSCFEFMRIEWTYIPANAQGGPGYQSPVDFDLKTGRRL
jgi:hypothetical protein